jgi:hypothetical protein
MKTQESSQIKAALERLIAGTATEADRDSLQQALQAGTIAVVTGERAVAVGGDATGAVITTGDGNVVLSFKEVDAAAIREILTSISSGVSPQMLDLEISHRLGPLPILMADIFTYTQLHTAKGSVLGKAEFHPRVGKLGEFEPLFSEFQGRSLFSLIWELQQLVPDQEKETLTNPLESARKLPNFFDQLILLVPVGEDDSKWQMDRGFLVQYKEVLKGFDTGRWRA